MPKEGIKEEICKYCHNFYSTLCSKCGVYTGKGVPDYCCFGDKKEVQKNWTNHLKAQYLLEQGLIEGLTKKLVKEGQID